MMQMHINSFNHHNIEYSSLRSLYKSFLKKVSIITSERSERSAYQQSYMGRLDDIQTALKLKKNGKNVNTLL